MISSLKFLIIFSIFFVPGIIWNFIAIKYKHGRNRNPSDTIFIIQSIVLTVITYFFEFLLFKIYDHSFKLFELFNNEICNNGKEAISSDLIYFAIYSIPLALFLSVLDLYLGKVGFFQSILGKLPFKPTERYGHEDVWEYYIRMRKGSSTKRNNDFLKRQDNTWVDIRDFENKIIYSGCIDLYSDTDKIRELLLKNVRVYDFEGNGLYEVSEMYISRPSESVIMEVRTTRIEDQAVGEDDEKK